MITIHEVFSKEFIKFMTPDYNHGCNYYNAKGMEEEEEPIFLLLVLLSNQSLLKEMNEPKFLFVFYLPYLPAFKECNYKA